MVRRPAARPLLLCALLLPAITSAQATLSGTVRDSSGAILPGVSVDTASPALIEKVRSATTDGSGRCRSRSTTNCPPVRRSRRAPP